MKLLWILLFIFSFIFNTKAQSYRTQQNQIFAYNVLFNGIIGGLGGAMHRSENEKFLNAFLKNFGKACLGGFVKYSAKYQAYYLGSPKNTFLAPFNRLYFFMGQSIVHNASMNRKMLDAYYFNFYGIDWSFQFHQQENRLKGKISLATAYSITDFMLHGHKLDIYKSFEYGQFYFQLDTTAYASTTIITEGISQFNVFAIRKASGITSYFAIPHEIIHTYQSYDFFPISSIYSLKLEKYYKDKKIYKKLSKFMILDYEAVFFPIAYSLQPKPKYYKNFYEFEAEHFNSRVLIER